MYLRVLQMAGYLLNRRPTVSEKVRGVSQSVKQLVLYPLKGHVTKQTPCRPDKVLVHGAMAKSAFHFLALSHNCEKRLLASSSLRPSVRPHENLGYH